MKILLSWVLDYLDCSLTDINVDSLVHLFNTRTAEIEAFDRVECDATSFFVAQVTRADQHKTVLFCQELGSSLELPLRLDAVIGKHYMLVCKDKSWRWLSASDFCNEKEYLFPAVHINKQELQDGSWRKKIASVDYVLDVDNKSINHRPDLWGHYGIAREIAAFLQIKLKPLPVDNHTVVDHGSKNKALSISIQDDACSRFAALECDHIKNQDSSLWMAIRLLHVGAKPICGIVDLTNYVMFDIGHPMHVFDAQDFESKEIVVRKAKSGEEICILDGQVLKLTSQDLVVANNKSPVSLAGIMGGKNSGFSQETTAVVLEAAGFDPAVIRKTAQHFKLRTEASIRFEKHLDPMQNIATIQRFLRLAQHEGMIDSVQNSIVSAGATVGPVVCDISHDFIERRIGTPMQQDFIVSTLKSLGFGVEVENRLYRVTVPTYRTTKDIGITEDILEEIIRFYGFENIEPILPSRSIAPFSFSVVDNVAKIKNYLSYGMAMHEVRDYLLYDASFVQRLKLDTSCAVKIRNPLSENWTTLVTSLVPHLLKGVENNFVQHESIRLFEYNCTWLKDGSAINEKKSWSGIVFDKKEVDFYNIKRELQGLWDLFGVEVTWLKPQGEIPLWYDQYKVARLVVGDECIGWAGMMSSQWMHDIVAGQAFIFELDGEFFETLTSHKNQFKAWSKYQEVFYDMSLLIPLSVTVDQLKRDVLSAHEFIGSVELVDFFEKEEWVDRRSVTLRYKMNNPERTMTKKDLDEIVESVIKVVKKHDAQIR